MFRLPPSVQMILFLIVGFTGGTGVGYNYSQAKVESAMAKNELHLIIDDKQAIKGIDIVTERNLEKITNEIKTKKSFNCSTAKLPNDRVLKLQREIDNARRRSLGTVLDRAIEEAGHF